MLLAAVISLCVLPFHSQYSSWKPPLVFQYVNPAMPIAPNFLFVNLCCVRRVARPPYCPPAPSPADFISSAHLLSLLLDFPCANPASPMTLYSYWIFAVSSAWQPSWALLFLFHLQCSFTKPLIFHVQIQLCQLHSTFCYWIVPSSFA